MCSQSVPTEKQPRNTESMLWQAPSKRTNLISWPVGAGRTASTRKQPRITEKERTMWEQIESALHASLARVLTKVATLLPAVLSLVLAVLVCALLGLFLAYILRKILVAVHFDERVKANSPAGLLHW